MRFLVIILIFITTASVAQTDTLTLQPDTLRNQASATLDSLQQAFTNRSDSLRDAYTVQKQKLSALKQNYMLRIDSLKRKRPSGNPVDTTFSKIQVKRYEHTIDSLDKQVAVLRHRTTAQLDSLKLGVNNKLRKLKIPKGAQGKATAFMSDLNKADVPLLNSDLDSNVNFEGINDAVPSIPGGNVPGLPVPNTTLPDLNGNLPGSNVSTPNVKSNLPGSPVNTGKLAGVHGQVGDAQKQLKEATASTDGLGKTLEAKAGEQVKDMPDNTLPAQPGLPGGIPKTSDAAKDQLTGIAKKEAVNHFSGKETVLLGAIDKMSKYKQKYASVNSLEEIKDQKHHNELNGKPLRERIVPAITWQFQRWHDLMLDINPSVGYKITSHVTAGLGWNQRIAFNISDRAFNRQAHSYGIRSYGEYTLKKGFGFRLDIESMNTPIRQTAQATDAPAYRAWVWSALIGVKQKYPIYRKLKGNAQLMYNIFDRDHRSPYTDRVNFRIGLELTLKQKKAAAKSTGQ